MSNVKTINVGYLARVEGEGGLNVKIEGDKVTQDSFEIFEPPRFFEAFLRGRKYTEPPDITARICGICPVAYQMSACVSQTATLIADAAVAWPGLSAPRRAAPAAESTILHGSPATTVEALRRPGRTPGCPRA